MNKKDLIAAAFAVLAMLMAHEALAVTKLRDGFGSMLVTDGTSLMPRNPITRAHGGDDVYYWIQWKEPMPRSVLRCVIKGPGTSIDETENFAEAEGMGFSVCGMGTEDSEEGTFTFTQYIDGEMVGERSIMVEATPFFKGGIRKKWKWMMGGLAAVILAVYWFRRAATGDKRSLAQVMGGEAPAERAVREAIQIGSRARGAGQVATSSSSAQPSRSDPATELDGVAREFQSQMRQPDKARGLESGRRYLGLLLKARNDAEALKVFKECLAADPAFRLAQAEEVLPFAKAARAGGDPQAAVAALRGFDKVHPGHGLIPEVYVFSAKLMAEDLGNVAMARKILTHVTEKYPGHYIAQEAKRYLQAMPQASTTP